MFFFESFKSMLMILCASLLFDIQIEHANNLFKNKFKNFILEP